MVSRLGLLSECCGKRRSSKLIIFACAAGSGLAFPEYWPGISSCSSNLEPWNSDSHREWALSDLMLLGGFLFLSRCSTFSKAPLKFWKSVFLNLSNLDPFSPSSVIIHQSHMYYITCTITYQMYQ